MHTAFEAALASAQRRHGGSRTQRVLRHPYRMVYPVVARRIGLERPVSCPTFFGATFHGILPEAVTTTVWRSTIYSPEVCRAVMHVLRPGDVFVDIGAHFGFFSLLAARLVGDTGRVLSIEAMPETYGYLERNMAPHVATGMAQLHNCAAFDEEITLNFKDYGIYASSLNTAFEHRGAAGFVRREPREVTVTAHTADNLIAEAGVAPTLIKIDTESAELFVLRGLEQTLRNARPALIMELGDPEGVSPPPSAEICALLADHGYSGVIFPGPEPQPFKLESPLAYANVLFLPEGSPRD